MEKLLAILAAVIIFIIWASIKSSRIHKDRLKKLKTILNKVSQLLNSNISEIYLDDISYNDARGVMEWFFQIQNNKIYKKPDETSEIAKLIKKFKAKPNPYWIKNSESFLLQINNTDYLIVLPRGQRYQNSTSTLLEIEKVTSNTPLTTTPDEYPPDWNIISANCRRKAT